MTVKERLTADMKEAMKARDTGRLSAIRMVINAIKTREKEGKKELSEEEVVQTVASDIKKRKDSVEQFKQGGRDDLVAAEEEAIAVLMAYMPEQMEEEEIRQVVAAAVAEAGASSMKDMGAVMKLVMPKVKGKADGGLVNKIVKEALSG